MFMMAFATAAMMLMLKTCLRKFFHKSLQSKSNIYNPSSAIWANPLDDEGHGMGKETFGQLKTWDMNILHTERAMAGLTIEMNVTIVVVALAILLTCLIVKYATPILEGVYHIMFQEKREGSKNA